MSAVSVSLHSLVWQLLLSIDISCWYGAQQQTHFSGVGDNISLSDVFSARDISILIDFSCSY